MDAWHTSYAWLAVNTTGRHNTLGGCVLARCINLHIQAYLVDKQVAVVSRLRPAVYGRLDIKVEAHLIGVRAVAHRVILHLPLVFDPIFDKFLAKHITNQ